MKFKRSKIISALLAIFMVFSLLTMGLSNATELIIGDNSLVIGSTPKEESKEEPQQVEEEPNAESEEVPQVLDEVPDITAGGEEVLIAGMKPSDYYSMLESGIMPTDIGNTGLQLELISGILAPPMTIGGRVAYCLNLWKDFPVGNDYPTSNPYANNKIVATLYHGYPVDASGLQGQYGVTDEEARYYTQVVVWQAMGDLTGRDYGIGYVDALLAKMRSEDVGIKPFSVSDNTLNFSEQSDGTYLSQTITTSGASGTFTVSPSSSRIQVLDANSNTPISTANIGTPIKVKVAADFDGEVSVNISTSLKKPASLKWSGAPSNYQEMCEFKWGDPLPGASRLAGNIKSKGSIKIDKTDAVTGAPLAGAKFEIRRHSDNALITEVVTGKDGSATAGDLKFDEYVIKEVEAPANYWIDSTPHRVVINAANKNYVHKATNRPKRAQIKITKKDAETQELLGGAVFEIKNTATQVVTKVTTTADGTVTSDWMTPGVYEVREVQPPTGYNLSTDPVQTIEVTGNPELMEVTFSNTKIRGKLKVIKLDGDSGMPLEGAVFGVFKKGTDQKVVELTTDKNGMATTDWLDYGNYDVKELKAPDGYYITDQVWDLNITENEKVYVLKIDNAPAKAIIRVVKTDSETKKPLEGVGFKIQDSDGKDVVFKVLNDDGEYDEVDTFFTNSEGIADTPGYLFKGNYKLIEVQHSPLYIGIEPIDFTISESEIYPEIELKPTKVIDVENDKIKGSLEILKLFSPTKTDNRLRPFTTPERLFAMRAQEILNQPTEPEEPEEPVAPDKESVEGEGDNNSDAVVPDDERPALPVDEDLSQKSEPYGLKSARFELYKLNSEILYPDMTDEEKELAEWELLGTFETDELGKIGLDGLTYGSYALVEIDTPHDFLPVDDIYFEILNNGEPVVIEVINQSATGMCEITKVDIHDGELLPGAKFEILDEDKNVILEGVTDENGIFSFTLGIGKYYYKETEAPSLNGTEYILDENEYPFEIKENGEVVKCKAPNKKRKVPKTVADFGGASTAIALSTILGSCYILKKRK